MKYLQLLIWTALHYKRDSAESTYPNVCINNVLAELIKQTIKAVSEFGLCLYRIFISTRLNYLFDKYRSTKKRFAIFAFSNIQYSIQWKCDNFAYYI